MKHLFIFSLLQFITFYLFAQKEKNSTNSKYEVTIDHDGEKFIIPTNKKNYPKNLKVGSYLYFTINNLPYKSKVQATAVFENGNMESGSLFSTFLNKDLENVKEEEDKKEIKNDQKKSADSSIENIKLQAQKNDFFEPKDLMNKPSMEVNEILNDENLRKSKLNNGLNQNKNQKKYKIDIFDLPNILQINEAESYLRKYKSENKENTSAYRAYLDIQWLKYVLKIADINIKEFTRKNDSIIKNYAQKIDILSSKIENSKKVLATFNKKLIGIQVLNTDYTNIKIEIKDSNNNIVNVIPLSYNNVGGFKLDFSTGFFNSIYESFNYKIMPKDTIINGNSTALDSIYRVAKNSNGKNNISFGILAHAYMRCGQYFSPGLATGFTYTPSSKTINFLLGISALLGRQQRFIITSGLAYSKVKELEYFSTEKFYHKSIINLSTNLSYNDKTRKSFFFGVSYNLGSIGGGRSETKALQ